MQTISFIPGSFAPPHRGHLEMIKYYAGISDYVIVVVSNPKNQSRRDDSPGWRVTPEMSKRILEEFRIGAGLDNVRIAVSPDPSPVVYVLKTAQTLKDCRITIGLSKKDGEASKYDALTAKAETGPGSVIGKPSDTAFEPDEDISSKDIRADMSRYAEFLPDCVDAGKVLSIASGASRFVNEVKDAGSTFLYLKNFNPWGMTKPDCMVRSVSAALMMKYRDVCRHLKIPYRNGYGRENNGIRIDRIKNSDLAEHFDFDAGNDLAVKAWQSVHGEKMHGKGRERLGITFKDALSYLKRTSDGKTAAYILFSPTHAAAAYVTKNQAYVVDTYDSTGDQLEDIVKVVSQVPAGDPDRLAVGDFIRGKSGALVNRVVNELHTNAERTKALAGIEYCDLPMHILKRVPGLCMYLTANEMKRRLGRFGIRLRGRARPNQKRQDHIMYFDAVPGSDIVSDMPDTGFYIQNSKPDQTARRALLQLAEKNAELYRNADLVDNIIGLMEKSPNCIMIGFQSLNGKIYMKIRISNDTSVINSRYNANISCDLVEITDQIRTRKKKN